MGTRGDKTVGKWYSERLRRQVTMVRWGVVGQPVLIFPTAGGDAEEIERWQMIDVLGPLIDKGRIKVYSCDSVAGMALVNREGSPRHQMWMQNEFHHYVRHEVVPAIYKDCKSELPIWSAGASFGAFHAAAVICRFPDVFTRAIALSGTYDLRRFFDAKYSEFTEDYYVSTPVFFVPKLSGKHLEVLRSRFVYIGCGQGRAENIGESWHLANVLGKAGIPNRVDDWGPEWPHDWVTWRNKLPQILESWTREGS
jgi:esterase/lipase superfamily enzyme